MGMHENEEDCDLCNKQENKMSDYKCALEVAKTVSKENPYAQVDSHELMLSIQCIAKALLAAEAQLKAAEEIFEKFNRSGLRSLCENWLIRRKETK